MGLTRIYRNTKRKKTNHKGRSQYEKFKPTKFKKKTES